MMRRWPSVDRYFCAASSCPDVFKIDEVRRISIATHSPQPIAILTTGGTIDKQYFDALSNYRIGESAVLRLLETARVTYPFTVHEVLRKDSLEMTDQDRAQLVEAVLAAPSNRVLVTHGTDTMAASAEALKVIDGKTIVLVGALAPAIFSITDAPFNLGMAFACCQVAPPGVFMTMNGTVFRAGEGVKDREAGGFRWMET